MRLTESLRAPRGWRPLTLLLNLIEDLFEIFIDVIYGIFFLCITSVLLWGLLMTLIGLWVILGWLIR